VAEFDMADDYGATSVHIFVAASDIRGDRSEANWQWSVCAQVGVLPPAIGIGG
jgi:hypothetical protein